MSLDIAATAAAMAEGECIWQQRARQAEQQRAENIWARQDLLGGVGGVRVVSE